ncbi:hypothetical protein CYMTET_22193 [Cymbomonas tetramitiformis]|uniref:Receptor ligand binding region domain-containing protein n=1 Tax=Cymbomonas tetramitiformis TaxID=36881 RepID=A0AAE0G0P1_9CHLO|nr:hypothetical protein CYMTET_22193 [Cymbomonas tetramitiformis]
MCKVANGIFVVVTLLQVIHVKCDSDVSMILLEQFTDAANTSVNFVRRSVASSEKVGKGRTLAQDKVNDIRGGKYSGNVKIAGLFPLFKTAAGDCQFDSAGARRLQAFLMALEEINNSSDILPNTRLSYSLYDSKRDAGISFFQAIAAQVWGSRVVVGPANSGSSVNSQLVLREYAIPQISYSSTSASLSVVEDYPYFMRTCPSDALQVAARERGIDILSTQSFPPNADDFSTQIQATLESKALIIMIFCNLDAATHLLEQGYGMGLGGSGYVFLGSDSVTNKQIYDRFTEGVDVPNIMRGFHGFHAYSGYGTYAHDAFIENWTTLAPTYNESTGLSTWAFAVESGPETSLFGQNQVRVWVWIHSMRTVTGWCSDAKDDAGAFLWRRYDVECIDESFITYDACAGFIPDRADVSGYVAYTYDATYTVAYALHELIEVRGIPEEELNGDEIFSAMKNVSFMGATGLVSFDQETGDRTEGVGYIIVNSDGYINNPIGVWNGNTGISMCDPLAEEHTNKLIAVECDVAQVWSTGEDSVPRDKLLTCMAGHYYLEDQGTCVACPDGFFTATSGASSCTPCPAGTYDDTPGFPSVGCTRCPPGEFTPDMNMSSSTGCNPCGPGTYQDKFMQTSCLDCPPGFFISVARSAECLKCPAGW